MFSDIFDAADDIELGSNSLQSKLWNPNSGLIKHVELDPYHLLIPDLN